MSMLDIGIQLYFYLPIAKTRLRSGCSLGGRASRDQVAIELAAILDA